MDYSPTSNATWKLLPYFDLFVSVVFTLFLKSFWDSTSVLYDVVTGVVSSGDQRAWQIPSCILLVLVYALRSLSSCVKQWCILKFPWRGEKRHEQADQWVRNPYGWYEKFSIVGISLMSDFNNSQVTNLIYLETFIASYEVTSTQNLCILCVVASVHRVSFMPLKCLAVT